jgi:hypothetical protein
MHATAINNRHIRDAPSPCITTGNHWPRAPPPATVAIVHRRGKGVHRRQRLLPSSCTPPPSTTVAFVTPYAAISNRPPLPAIAFAPCTVVAFAVPCNSVNDHQLRGAVPTAIGDCHVRTTLTSTASAMMSIAVGSRRRRRVPTPARCCSCRVPPSAATAFTMLTTVISQRRSGRTRSTTAAVSAIGSYSAHHAPPLATPIFTVHRCQRALFGCEHYLRDDTGLLRDAPGDHICEAAHCFREPLSTIA